VNGVAMGRNRKSDQPSALDSLASRVAEALAKDWAEHGDEVIVRIREEDPVEYRKLIVRLVPQDALVPAPGAYADCNSMADIGRRLLEQVGVIDPSEDQVARAVQVNNEFMGKLEAIRDEMLQ
jgi:hypothetical protein